MEVDFGLLMEGPWDQRRYGGGESRRLGFSFARSGFPLLRSPAKASWCRRVTRRDSSSILDLPVPCGGVTVGGRTRRAAKRGSASIFEIDARHRSWTTDLSSEEEVLAVDAWRRSAYRIRIQHVTGPKLWSLLSLKLRTGVLVSLTDIKARLSFRTVSFGSWLRVGVVLAGGKEFLVEMRLLGKVLLVHELKSHNMETNRLELCRRWLNLLSPTVSLPSSHFNVIVFDPPFSTELFRF